MAVPRTPLWPIQPHTQVKHAILRRYLDAWLPIMSRYNGRIVFIDGFAGPGRYTGGEDGSPVIALKALLDHPHFRAADRGVEIVFLFIEDRADRLATLREVLVELERDRPLPSWVKVEVIDGKFAANLNRMLDFVERAGPQLAPTFVLVDPFGFSGVPLTVIARLVRNPRCECLINFSFDSINRFLEHPEPELLKHFDDLFGSQDWRTVIKVSGDAGERRDKILQLYRRQLVGLARLKYVRTFEMVNEGNRTAYILFFGTNSSEGLSKMKQAMWKADPLGGQIFSDRSDSDQLVLLGVGGEMGLAATLRKRYAGGKPVSIEAVQRFVLEETPYSERIHLKARTLKPMEKASPPQIEVRRPPGARKVAGQYPSGTMVKFL